MALLQGFQKLKPKGSGGVSVDLLEKAYLTTTQGGAYNTVEDVDGFIKKLNALPQTKQVVEKQYELTNKRLQFETKLDDVLSSKNVFDTDLHESLDSAAQSNYKNVKSLIGSYAAIYGDASEKYDSDVLSQITQRYGTMDTVPAETLTYRKDLQDKAKFYAQLFNAYNQRDPKTGAVGTVNPDGFAVLVDTNPANGKINRIDIIPSGEVDGKNYMRTDTGMNVVDGVPNTKLPIYLRTYNAGTTKEGRSIRGGQLGNITYQAVDNQNDNEDVGGAGVGILKAQKAHVGFWDRLNIFSSSQSEQQSASVDSIVANGISLASPAYGYDSSDVPNGNVLRLGNRVFYSSDKQDEIFEIDGKTTSEKQDNLNQYLQSIGKDPTKTLPYFITKDYLTAPDGSSRVKGKVNKDFFSQPLPASSEQIGAPVAPPAQSQEKPMSSIQNSSFFASQSQQESSGTTTRATPQVNRQSKPIAQKESSGGNISVNDVVDKGKSFFRLRDTA